MNPTSLPKLNFPPIELRSRRNCEDGSISVWVASRGCYLVLTPEEWVRRHIVGFLISNCGIEATQICEEYPIKITGQSQRADIVVIDNCCKPKILIECKAPSITIDKEVFAQAVRYNSALGAQYIILTNGLKHFCFEFIDGNYTPLMEFPSLK
ncbi:MAG: type I restriction enzyme HsdR N-terminal domain-containing protein [Rikenellaceae bacterium]